MSQDLRVTTGVTRGARVRVSFEGRMIDAYRGESLSAALLAAGIRVLRRAPSDGGARGLFCAMGMCQECVVLIDGRHVEACRVTVCDGLDVRAVG